MQHGNCDAGGGASWSWNSETSTEATSVMSFASSSGAAPLDGRSRTSAQLEVKVDMVYSLLSMLGTQECPDMGETLLALSRSPDSSLAMRQAGCLPVLVQLVYSDKERETREKAAEALQNLVQAQPDDKTRKRELKVWRILEEMRRYCGAAHPAQAAENVIKLSFDEAYRHTICELGGIYALAQLVETDHEVHGTLAEAAEECATVRRYAGMALTNLTFGHGHNKTLLCSFPGFVRCLVAQLEGDGDELKQVTASVVRNLSWRADAASRTALREAGCVAALTHAAMSSRKESTLKSVLSALWNLSAHCSTNKADICAVPGALAFLADALTYRSPAIVENAGGILRNVSSHVAVREDYREVLRARGCLQVLLQQLRSPSLTVVGNACGTLWNLSAKSAQDQKALWEMGAAPMLRSLNHSKHSAIATGSRAALKNLLSSKAAAAKGDLSSQTRSDSASTKELCLPALPSLGARKRRALVKDLGRNLTETCENIEPDQEDARLSDALGTLAVAASDDDDDDDQPVDYSRKYGGETVKTTAAAEFDQEDTVRTYCTEGTPYETPYNRSMSDLREDPAMSSTKKEEKETPLMFSRCSSLGSLSSADQHSIRDDRSSAVSSRMTSGAISPSELPDSPTQAVPPPPRQQRQPPTTEDNASVFEDHLIRFKQTEDTPAEFSRGTSLSSLTIDPVTPAASASAPALSCEEDEEEEVLVAECILSGMPAAPRRTSSDDDDDGDEEEEDDDEMLLEQCISSGMPKNGGGGGCGSGGGGGGGLADDGVPVRMLDPDAMIESLDRFTAELVSQSSHLTLARSQQQQQQQQQPSTWNDDTSPNDDDVSFPSISCSIPTAADSPLTDSTLIAIEADKVALAARGMAAAMAASLETPLLLDQVRPPSAMESLLSLTESINNNHQPPPPIEDEPPPPPVKKTTTPKQRRTDDSDRYKTFTLGPAPAPAKRQTPRDRRKADRDRFQTRVIDDADMLLRAGAVAVLDTLTKEMEPPPPQSDFIKTFTKGTRIVKPSKKRETEQQQPANKTVAVAVRGKRKPLYASSASSSSSSSALPKPKLERQGTFTKESPTRTPPPQHPQTAAPRLPSKIARPKTAPSSSSSSSASQMRSSTSSQSLQNASASNNYPSRSKPKRSNSNAGIETNAISSRKKHQVASKIAGLWKKVEDSKTKPKQKDDRVWIKSGAEHSADSQRPNTTTTTNRFIKRRDVTAA